MLGFFWKSLLVHRFSTYFHDEFVLARLKDTSTERWAYNARTKHMHSKLTFSAYKAGDRYVHSVATEQTQINCFFFVSFGRKTTWEHALFINNGIWYGLHSIGINISILNAFYLLYISAHRLMKTIDINTYLNPN